VVSIGRNFCQRDRPFCRQLYGNDYRRSQRYCNGIGHHYGTDGVGRSDRFPNERSVQRRRYGFGNGFGFRRNGNGDLFLEQHPYPVYGYGIEFGGRHLHGDGHRCKQLYGYQHGDNHPTGCGGKCYCICYSRFGERCK
jgi:hypothetical protein